MVQEAHTAGPTTGLLLGAIVTLFTVLAAVWMVVTSATPFEVWGTLVIGPALVLLTIPSLRRQGAREGDPTVFWFLLLALLFKLCGAVARYTVAFTVYDGGDVNRYHDWGVTVSQSFAVGNFDTGFEFGGTDFIALATGAVYTIIGPNKLGGFFVFSWLSFWGLFLFYRAFVQAVPDGRRRMYGILLFFLPSLMFWPSGIGKEAWIMFGLGLAAFGAARALSGSHVPGLAMAVVGLWLTAIVRPHIAGLVAIALAAGYLMRRPRKELSYLSPLAKGVSLVVLGAIAIVFIARTEQFLEESGIETGSGVTSVLEQTSDRTGKGGSEFEPTVIGAPQQLPLAVVTVLFRPFVFEADNTQALIAAAEGSFLLLLTIVRFRWFIGALKRLRRDPYIALAFVYAGSFIVAYSGFANFGLLARQRVQLLPFYLVLLSIPPVAGAASRASRRLGIEQPVEAESQSVAVRR